MSCLCINNLKNFLKSLKNAPLNELLKLIPKIPDLPAVTTLAAGQGNLQAMAGLSAQMHAALRLGLPALSLPQLSLVARLEAMAMVSASLGANALSAGASAAARFAVTVGSINAHLPSLLSALMNLLDPLWDALQDLLALTNAMQAVQMNLGINLLSPGAGLKLAAAARASLSASASASLGSLTALTGYARLAAAAAALGIDIFAPGGMARLSAALSLAASVQVPPLTVPLPQLARAAVALQAIAAARLSFGANLFLPSARDLLKAALAALLPNLQAVAQMSVSQAATLGASLGGVPQALGLNLQALAALKLAANLKLPDLGGLALVAHLTEQMKLAVPGSSIMATSACSGCPFL